MSDPPSGPSHASSSSEIASSSGRTTIVNTDHAIAAINGHDGAAAAAAAGGAARAGISNLDMAKVTSPTVERSNPLRMDVTARHSGGASGNGASTRPKLKRKAGTSSGMVGSSSKDNASAQAMQVSTSKNGKGRATSGESDDDEPMEPKDAIRQQFYVCLSSRGH